MSKTNDPNTVGGIYVCECCNERVAQAFGYKFPPCPRCHRATTYELLFATVQ
jgi:hypothetical protein